MGPGKASEMLLFGKKVTAKEAENLGLITEVYSADKFGSIWSRLKELSELPSLVSFKTYYFSSFDKSKFVLFLAQSLMYGKQLVRNVDRALLHDVNRAEMKKLAELGKTDQTMEAMAKWFSRRSASKL